MSHVNELAKYLEVEEDIDAALERAYLYASKSNFDKCLQVCSRVLTNQDPNCAMALHLMAHCFVQADRLGPAYTLMRRVVELSPKRAEAWNLLGRCLQRPENYEEAEGYLKRAIELDPKDASAMINLGLIHLNRAEPLKCIDWCERAITTGIEGTEWLNAKDNIALAQLMLRRWPEGWDNYTYMLGRRQRMEVEYFGEPRWEGERVNTIIVTGEQGIGDELLFSQCLQDLRKDAKKIILDCDSRLEGLFTRSFPDCRVYGTRRDFNPTWREGDGEADAHTAIGSLPRFYRRRDEQFRKEPWLVACPERRRMYRALLDGLGDEPKIGIAWVGGWKNFERSVRSVPLEMWRPILSQPAHFVDLEYLNPQATFGKLPEDFPTIHHFPWATLTDDYDDTAALVAELDLVISVTTSVGHLAGALGTENWWLVNKHANWRFGLEGDLPWHEARFFRQARNETWEPVIQRVEEALSEYLHRRGRETVGGVHGARSEHREALIHPGLSDAAADRAAAY